MASDILISHIKLPHYSEGNGYNDHLFENKILDIDEPQYENCEILRNILHKSLNCQNDKYNNNMPSMPPKFEPRITVGLNKPRPNSISTKEIEKENIYENVNFINKYSKIYVMDDCPVSSSPQINDEETLPKNCYRSTLSLIIGKPNCIDSQPVESKNLFNSVVKEETNNYTADDELETNVAVDHEESDDSSFKSSYAKSLMDSFHRTCNSPSTDLSRISSPNQDDSIKLVHNESLNSNLFLTDNCTVVKNRLPKIIHTSLSPPTAESKSIITYSPEIVEQLEKKVGYLTDDLHNKDKELEKLKQDLISLRLDFNHIKAENRSLKVSQNMNLRNSLCGLNGESQPSSLTSISATSDTWTLQQQVMSLNAQLEKAELSRHAYEAASRQLVHFLQTINTTLTTVSGSDLSSNQNDSVFFSPSTTQDLLSHLESTLTSKRYNKLDTTRRSESPTVKPHWFDKNREGSFISDTSIGPSYMNASVEHSDIHTILPEQRSNGSSGRNYVKKERRVKVVRSRISRSNSKSKEEESYCRPNVSNLETTPHQRTNSIPGRIFYGTKKSLVRSESVNDIPTGNVTHIPRVSRAMSTHCVNKIDISESKDQSTNASSNRLVSARAKGFFTSLRSIFKNDHEKSPTESTGTTLRKKMTLPLMYRSSKAKYDLQVQNLLSVLPSHNNATSNLQKKNASDHIDSRVPISDVSFESEKSLQNSIFYVPCYPIDDTTLEDSEVDLTLDDNDNDTTVNNAEIDTSREELEVSQPTISAKNVKSHNQRVQNNSSNFNDLGKDSFSSDVELSGPQEISVTLSFHQDNTDNESGHSKCSSFTGDGYCTAGSTRQLRDNSITSRTIKPGGGLNCFNTIGKKLSPTKNNKARLSPIRETFNSCKHATNECGSNAETNCSRKTVTFFDGTSINIRVSCGSNDRVSNVPKELGRKCTSTNIACDTKEQNPNKFSSSYLKQALWKLSRSSYRDPRCRIEFV